MSRSGRPEILAPAGDEASLRAALAAGAGTVYLGLDEGFNARARAGNFPAAELGRVVEFSQRTESAARPDEIVQRIRVTDPESRNQNAKRSKDVAPHYSPQIVVDVESGIVAEDVVNEATDRGQLLPMTVRAVENTGVVPATMSADSGYSQGSDLQALESLGIDAYAPEQGNKGPKARAERAEAINALQRGEDLTEEQWTAITGTSAKKKARRLPPEAFEYDQERDVYICPMGATLPYVRTEINKTRAGPTR